MTRKVYRQGQDRAGNRRRRRYEFEVVRDQVKRRKDKFADRLIARIRGLPNGCVEYRGTLDHKGYPRMTFKYKGQHVNMRAHSVFAILMTRAPIPIGMEVDHECKNRRCVRHLRLIPYKENAANVEKDQPCPF